MNSLNLSVSKNISLNKAVHATSGSHLQFCLLPEIVACSLLFRVETAICVHIFRRIGTYISNLSDRSSCMISILAVRS